MINRKSILLSLSCVVILLMIALPSCKKDRIPADDYQDMDSFYNDNEEEEQEFTIDSTGSGTCYITAKKGTRICVTRDMLRDAGGNDIPNYPFQLKVIELYTIRDMILRRQPSVASGSILETTAEIRVRPHKNGNEAFLKPGRKYFMETANFTSTVSGMDSYYGFDNGGTGDWTNNLSSLIPAFIDTLSSVNIVASYYALTPAKTDYVSAAKLNNSTAATSIITLTVPGTNTQNLQAFFKFNNFKSVMRVTNLVSLPVPVGESITMVVFGKKQTNEFVLHQQTFTVTAGLTIPLTMQVVTEAGLLAALDAL